MDLLSEALTSLKWDSHALGVFRLHGDWGFDIEGVLPGYCYVVIDGECWVQLDGCDPAPLKMGDALLAPRGGSLRLASTPDAPRVSMANVWRAHRMPMFERYTPLTTPVRFDYFAPSANAIDRITSPTTQLLAIAFSFSDDERRFVEALPLQIVSRASDIAVAPWVRSSVQFLAAEEAAINPGFVAIAAGLSELILVSLIRDYALTEESPPTSWLKGLTDPRIGRALEAMHRQPAFAWSVNALAGVALMSRAGFAARFMQLVGQSPIEYLTALRMQIARRIVDESSSQIAEVATRVGYRSERAFRSAFKKHVGMSPLHRRQSTSGLRT